MRVCFHCKCGKCQTSRLYLVTVVVYTPSLGVRPTPDPGETLRVQFMSFCKDTNIYISIDISIYIYADVARANVYIMHINASTYTMSLLIPPGYCTNLRCTVLKTGAAVAVTEVSAPNSKPCLFPHEISIWPQCGIVLTGGIRGPASLPTRFPSDHSVVLCWLVEYGVPPLCPHIFHLNATFPSDRHVVLGWLVCRRLIPEVKWL